MAVDTAAVADMAVLAAGMGEAAIRAALAGIALVRVGLTLALAGMVVAVTGMAAAGTVGVVAGIIVITVVVGELARRSVSVLALDYSGERSQRLPTTVAMTIAMIMPLMPARPHLRFGIGAMPIRATTLRSPNARFLGDKCFSNFYQSVRPLGGV